LACRNKDVGCLRDVSELISRNSEFFKSFSYLKNRKNMIWGSIYGKIWVFTSFFYFPFQGWKSKRVKEKIYFFFYIFQIFRMYTKECKRFEKDSSCTYRAITRCPKNELSTSLGGGFTKFYTRSIGCDLRQTYFFF
jgi:hypothetical protein